MSFSLKQNYRFHDVNNSNKKNSHSSKLLSNPGTLSYMTHFSIIAARRAAIIMLSDLFTSADADLSTQVFVPTAASALIVETPFYAWDVTNKIKKLHLADNPLTIISSAANSTKANVANNNNNMIIPVSWRNIVSNVRGLEFTCFSSHCLVVAFYWGNYIGRYYNLKSFMQRELKSKKPPKETIFLTEAAKRKADLQAKAKDFSFDLLAAELSRFWAVILRSPFEVIRTNLIRDFYYINNNVIPSNTVVKEEIQNAAAAVAATPANPLGRKFNGMGVCASKVLKEQGVRVLFRRCLRHFLSLSGLATSIALVSYDRARHGTEQLPEKLTLGKILY